MKQIISELYPIIPERRIFDLTQHFPNHELVTIRIWNREQAF
jgi:hypothetical protein